MSGAPAEELSPRDVARALADIATLLELHGEDSFRARAFASAARALEGTDADLRSLTAAGKLTSLRGIGPAIAEVVREMVETGRSAVMEELQAATPVGLYDLMRLPGLGTKRIRTLYSGLGVDSLDALETAARAGEVARLPGFGAKTEQKILEGLAFAREARGRRRYPDALEVAARLLDWLQDRPAVLAAEIVGPLRRRMEVVDRVDLVAASDEPQQVLTDFARLHGMEGASPSAGGELTGRLGDGLAVHLRCVPPEAFVAAVVVDTGSDAHLLDLQEAAAKGGLELSALGLREGGEQVPLEDEEALYSRLGLAYVPPELREGLGEVEEAAAGRVPVLVETADLRGTFHCHTVYSDGKATVAEMAEAARAQGWSYLGLADHSRAAAYAGGLSVELVREQQAEIDEWNRNEGAGGFRIFKGTESDILADGSLDYEDEVLASFDYVVGSVHSGFGQAEREMTQRLIRAVRHPSLTILGHPTGRLLLTRDAYSLDVRAVIDAAAEAGVVIEINANPHRLDLDWREVRYAASIGVLIAVNPDAHSTAGLAHVAYGVNMARKAGLTPRQILNCWTLDEVEAYFAARKQEG